MLSRVLADAAFGECPRTIVCMPPRHGKSELVSHWFCVWYLALFPRNRIILTSYEADFAAHWGRKVRDTITEQSTKLGIRVHRGTTAANRWSLNSGGGMVTAGVGGPITGKGGDLIIVDDPVKNFEQAYSPRYRERAWEWWTSTLRTRLEPGACIVVVMTRWHEDDLVGRLLEQEKTFGAPWHKVRMPATCEDPETDPLGRDHGDALWPKRYDVDALHDIKTDVGELVWNGLYQQRPAPLDGGYVKRSWLRYYDTLPKRFDEMLQSWDLPFKGALESDYAVGQVWGRKGADCYLVDQIRAKMDFPEILVAVETLTARNPNARRKLVEDAAAGAPMVATLKTKIPGLVLVPAKGTKEARLASVSAVFESGNVLLPNPKHIAWVSPYVEEILAFPGAANDDQVDATTQALTRLSNSAIERLRKLATM